MISMPPAQEEMQLIESILQKTGFIKKPNMILSIYKGRGSKYPKGIKIWQHVDLGTMRTEDLFATDKDYNLIHIEKTYVNTLEDKDDESEMDIKF